MNTSVFRGRAFISMLMLCGFIVVALSGIALFAAPRGWAAQAQEWRFLSLDKREWASLHIVFGILFPLVATVHISLNWRAVVGYLRSRWAARPLINVLNRMRLELVAALLVCVFLGAAALGTFPPASTLLDLRSILRGGEQAALGGGQNHGPPRRESSDNTDKKP